MTVWLLVPEVAEMLRTSEEHVRRLIRRGDLAAADVGIGGRPSYRIAEQAVEIYMAERLTSTALR